MQRLADVGRVLGMLSSLLLWACATDGGPVDDAAVPTSPLQVPTPPGADTLPRVLVDASRDGGVWWFPQGNPGKPFSGTDYHQGRALADSLRSLGYVVEELPRPFVITDALLKSYAIVIRAGAFGTYSSTEVEAFKKYVDRGGQLLLLADHMKYAPLDGIAFAFGITFAGITQGENYLNAFATHPITQDVEPLAYMVGSGVVSQPAAAQILGRLSMGSYLDLNKNGVRDPDEPSSPAVLGVLEYGQGRIVFCGDVNLWEQIPQPLVSNVLGWFKDG